MKIFNFERGQTMITLLFFSIVATTIISTVAVVTLVNSQSTSKLESSNTTYFLSEAGIENAIVRLLRDPTYTGENLSINGGYVTIIVTGTNPKVITAQASFQGFLRKVQVDIDYSNNILSVLSWKEIL